MTKHTFSLMIHETPCPIPAQVLRIRHLSWSHCTHGNPNPTLKTVKNEHGPDPPYGEPRPSLKPSIKALLAHNMIAFIDAEFPPNTHAKRMCWGGTPLGAP